MKYSVADLSEARSASRLLLVEDNGADVFLIRQALADQGFRGRLTLARDGEEAISMIDDWELDPKAPIPDLVVLDLNLPKRTGHEVLGHLRSTRRLRGVKVLILSSSDLLQDRNQAAKLGADQYFRKPPDLDGFLAVGRLITSMLR